MSLGSSVNSDVQVAAIPGWRAKVCFCLNILPGEEALEVALDLLVGREEPV